MQDGVSVLLDLAYLFPKCPGRALPFEAVKIHTSVFEENLEEKIPKSIQTLMTKGQLRYKAGGRFTMNEAINNGFH